MQMLKTVLEENLSCFYLSFCSELGTLSPGGTDLGTNVIFYIMSINTNQYKLCQSIQINTNVDLKRNENLSQTGD